MGQTKVTTDHGIIRRWTEERGGYPVMRDTPMGDPGMLRIDFPGYSQQESFEAIQWEEFFLEFEERNLAFLYEEKRDDGELSHFNELVKRKQVDKLAAESSQPS